MKVLTLAVTFNNDTPPQSFKFDANRANIVDVKVDAQKLIRRDNVATVLVTGVYGQVYVDYTRPAPVPAFV